MKRPSRLIRARLAREAELIGADYQNLIRCECSHSAESHDTNGDVFDLQYHHCLEVGCGCKQFKRVERKPPQAAG